jgi:hypothetical protein
MTAPAQLRLARRLSHDVGKYVARTAHNVPAGGWRAETARMLADDLLDLRGEHALQAFLRLSAEAEGALDGEVEWQSARQLLVDLEASEPGVRARDTATLDRCARQALEVERLLRQLVLRLDSLTKGHAE